MVNVVSAAEFKQAAAQHVEEHKRVKFYDLVERCNKALNAKITAFRQNKGLNDIAMIVNVQYMHHEFDIVDQVICELENAGYAVKKENYDSRDEDQYFLKIFVS